MKGAARGVLEAARGTTMAALRPLEASLLAREGTEPPDPPPCFVIGPPRSGTTLLYELLVTRFRVAYLSNLAHRMYRVPVAASRLGSPLIRRWHGSFESRYGHIPGWGAPNEGGKVWDRWMPGMHPLDATDASSMDVGELRATISALGRCFEGPFLNKNVAFSVRMRLLDAIFPGCLFIEVTRDPRDNIRSILRAERSEGGPRDATGWWSVKPREWQRHRDESAARRAAAQVRLVGANIAEDATDLGAKRRHLISYEDLCRSPEAILSEIQRFFLRNGMEVLLQGRPAQPFEITPSRPLEDAVEEEIKLATEPWTLTSGSATP